MSNGEAMRQFFSSIISLLKGVSVPGFSFSFFDFFLGIGVLTLSIFIARNLLHIGGSDDD